MNFIINGFHVDIYFSILSKILKRFRVKYCHLSYDGSRLPIPSGVFTVFHSVYDLAKGEYDICWEKITPLSEDLIESMYDCEANSLKMMDRLPQKLSYDERKSLYLKHLRYWNHVVSTNKIDLFLSSNVPHEVYDYIIYCLCKLNKIPTIFLFQSRISDTIVIGENIESNSAIQNKYRKLVKKYKHTGDTEIILYGRLKRDFDTNTGKNSPILFEMLRRKPSHRVIINLISLFFNIKTSRIIFFIRNPGLFIKSVSDHFSSVMLDSKLTAFYKGNSSEPDLTRKYIYFPLHMQPESSTSPLAGAYVNQILIAQMIAYHLPKDINIYVKENPYQTSIGRSMEFYKDLLRIPQVRFVPYSYSTHVLTANSLAVATATGTAGLEALYRCKPVLMFGHNFYQYAKGVFQIKDNLDCQRAIKKILLNNYKPDIKNIKLFLKALEDTTIEGYIDIDYQKDTKVAQDINSRNILRSIIKEINIVFHS